MEKIITKNCVKNLKNLSKISGIYKIVNPKGKVYIGQSIDIKNRFNSYFKKYKKNNSQIKLINSFNKYGVENHIFEIIEECEFDQLNTRERYWQDFFECLDKGLNCLLTSYNNKSGKMSEETKLKIKKANTGRIKSEKECLEISKRMSGRKLNDEIKQKISKTNKGKKHSQKTKDRMSKSHKLKVYEKHPNKGRKMSEITKSKISEYQKNKIKSEKTKEKIRLNQPKLKIIHKYDKFMNLLETYKGVNEASRKTNILQSSISMCLTGKSKTAGGFKWEYKK